jgi:hypothetical protein
MDKVIIFLIALILGIFISETADKLLSKDETNYRLGYVQGAISCQKTYTYGNYSAAFFDSIERIDLKEFKKRH